MPNDAEDEAIMRIDLATDLQRGIDKMRRMSNAVEASLSPAERDVLRRRFSIDRKASNVVQVHADEPKE